MLDLLAEASLPVHFIMATDETDRRKTIYIGAYNLDHEQVAPFSRGSGVADSLIEAGCRRALARDPNPFDCDTDHGTVSACISVDLWPLEVDEKIDEQARAVARHALRAPRAIAVRVGGAADVDVCPRNAVDKLLQEQPRGDRSCVHSAEVLEVRDLRVQLAAQSPIERQLPHGFIGPVSGGLELLDQLLADCS